MSFPFWKGGHRFHMVRGRQKRMPDDWTPPRGPECPWKVYGILIMGITPANTLHSLFLLDINYLALNDLYICNKSHHWSLITNLNCWAYMHVNSKYILILFVYVIETLKSHIVWLDVFAEKIYSIELIGLVHGFPTNSSPSKLWSHASWLKICEN